MADLIDLTKKPNRIVLALDIFLGTLFFKECYPTEPMSSYFWRKQLTKWIELANAVTFDPEHCQRSYEHSKEHAFDAPEYTYGYH